MIVVARQGMIVGLKITVITVVGKPRFCDLLHEVFEPFSKSLYYLACLLICLRHWLGG